MFSKQLVLILGLLFITALVSAQISVKLSLPDEMKLNSEVMVEARIIKGAIKNYSKYQIEVPQGLTVKEVDSNTGTFTFEDGIARIIWAITPADNELLVKFILVSGSIEAPMTLLQKYNYLEKGEKRETEMAPIQIHVVENLSTVTNTVADLPVSVNATKTNNTVTSAASPESETKTIENTEDLKIQVSQLKKDSKEATEIGEKEKKVAEQSLAEAKIAIVKANAIKNEKQRSTALKEANEAKALAENDLEVAERIISLARALDENAKEIEQLNQPLESEETVDSKTATVNTTSPAANGKQTVGSPAAERAKLEKSKQIAISKGAKEAKGMYKPIAPQGQNLSELKQQVDQIKVDAKDAMEVGAKEKKKAENKLSDAYALLKTAEETADPAQKARINEKANADKQRAEKDLEIASKIITLAKSLEENANEIEKVNFTQLIVAGDSSSKGFTIIPEPAPETKTIAPAKTTSTVTSALISESKAKPKIIKPISTVKIQKTESITEVPETGLVYKVQIGSCVNPPDQTVYIPIGKVQVVTEAGRYKVYVGAFKTREEAVKRKEEIISKGFDGFIVSFENGIKQK